MPFRRLDAATAQYLIQALARLFATYAIIQGAGIILGGSSRWTSSRGLAAALAVPGSPYTWGAILALAGAVALWGTFDHPRLAQLGCYLIAVWSGCFAIAIFLTFLGTNGATTGFITYGKDGIAAVVLAIAYRHVRP